MAAVPSLVKPVIGDFVNQMNGTRRAGRGAEPMRHIRLSATFTAGVALAAAAVTPSFADPPGLPHTKVARGPRSARRPSA